MYQPARIFVIDSGIFLDGGSIRIEAVDDLKIHYSLYLDRSFKAQDTHTTQLFINQTAIEKASAEESRWMTLLHSAEYHFQDQVLASLMSAPLDVDPADIADHLQKAELNPGWMSKYLVHLFITHLQSPEYHLPPSDMVIRLEEEQAGSH